MANNLTIQNLLEKVKRLELDELREMIEDMRSIQRQSSRVLTMLQIPGKSWSFVIRPLGVSVVVKASDLAGF